MQSPNALAELHTRLWGNCLDGTEQVLWQRPLPTVNAIGFLALHLVDTRHFTLDLLGAPAPNPFAALLADARSMSDLREHPEATALRPAWAAVSERLAERLSELGPDDFARPVARSFPIADPTLAGALSFLLSHEAYHLGQMALLRRAFGLAAMRY